MYTTMAAKQRYPSAKVIKLTAISPFDKSFFYNIKTTPYICTYIHVAFAIHITQGVHFVGKQVPYHGCHAKVPFFKANHML
jgi:hypothetical protein